MNETTTGASELLALDGIDLWSAPVTGMDLHALMDRARDAGPLVRATFAGRPAFLITRFAELRQYVCLPDEFPGGEFYRIGLEPAIGPSFISMEGHDHDVYRQLATPAFRSRAAQRFVDEDVVPLAHEVIDRFVSRGEGDLVAEFAQVLPFWAISRKLGLPVGTEDVQREWALAILGYPGDPEAAVTAGAEVRDFLAPILAERRRSPGDDVISLMLTSEYHGTRFTDEEICSHVLLLYAVGATTTSDAMSNLLRSLLTVPGLRERAQEDREVRARIVHEQLRFDPPVPVMPRMTPLAGTFAGVEIPAGSMVLCGIASANHDPLVFANPHVFDVDRRESDILTFGFGVKFCPGSHLARRQLEAGLDAVLDRLPGLGLVEASEPTNAILRRVEHVVARWDVPRR